MWLFDNCTHFLHSIVKTDGKPPVFSYAQDQKGGDAYEGIRLKSQTNDSV
jgi:hypothetical protein